MKREELIAKWAKILYDTVSSLLEEASPSGELEVDPDQLQARCTSLAKRLWREVG